MILDKKGTLQDQKLLIEFENRLFGTQIRVGQKSLNFAQIIYFKNLISKMTPECAWEAYNTLEHFCNNYGLEQPISLLELKNIKEYEAEQMLNEIKKDFE